MRGARLAAVLLLLAAPAAAAPRVMVLGIDGATWRVMDRLLAQGRMPNLKSLIDRGSRGDLLSFDNSLSEVVWTSIATGKTPEKHGITSLMPDGLHRVSSSQRKTKALWNILSEKGLRVAVVNYRVTWPAEDVNGVMLPYETLVFGESIRARATYPPDALASARAAGWDPAAPDPQGLDRFGPGLMDYWRANRASQSPEALLVKKQLLPYRKDLSAARLAAAVMKAQPFDCVISYRGGVDLVEHGFWKYMEPEGDALPPADLERFRPVIENYYVFVDQLLGELLARAGRETNVLVVSDHGFRREPSRNATFSGTHEKEGIFVAAGPAFRAAKEKSSGSVLDVAPTVLALFGLPAAKDMDGRPLAGILRSAPPAAIATYDSPGWSTPQAEGLVIDAEQKDWLRQLGYLK